MAKADVNWPLDSQIFYYMQFFFLRCFQIAALCALFFGFSFLQAQEVIRLQAVKDNTIYADNNQLANGGGLSFIAGNNGRNQSRRALIQFDVDTIAKRLDAGDRIMDVRLVLNAEQGNGNQSYRLHTLTRAWGEGAEVADNRPGKGVAAENGSSTWRHAFFDTVSWSTEGGDFRDTLSANFNVAGAGEVVVTGSLIEDVRAWAQNSIPNYGWIIVGNENSTKTTWRWSGRRARADQRPVLEVSLGDPAGLLTASARASRPALFPNPAQNWLQVASLPSSARLLRVVDAVGRTWMQSKIADRLQPVGLRVAHLPRGLYFLRIEGPDMVPQTMRFQLR
jgi:hypothetical protein